MSRSARLEENWQPSDKYLDYGLQRHSKPEAVPTLVQMLQAEDASRRLVLVRALAKISSRESSVSLAQRALFDVCEEARSAAIEALKDRPASDARSTLLDGLRHPWPVVADHAADVLVALRDRDAVPQLLEMLGQPDPRVPFQNETGKWVVAELVKVNHLRNCQQKDPVRGLIPTPGQPIPEVYYSARDGNFVRADVVFLRQEFSVMQHIKEPDRWPVLQRYDFLVRHRELSDDEIRFTKSLRQREQGQAKVSMYPQREAVIAALRGICNRRPE